MMTTGRHKSIRRDISVMLGRNKKPMDGPNGKFRHHEGAAPEPPNDKNRQSTFIRHCVEDPRCYEINQLMKQATRRAPLAPPCLGLSSTIGSQAQMGQDSPGPKYNTRPSPRAPGVIFAPKNVGQSPRALALQRSQAGKLPAIYSAGGPKVLNGMRTREKYVGVSPKNPATDVIFPTRNPNPAEQPPGYLVGHTSTFGKASDLADAGGHAGVQSNFASGPAVRFAPPFDQVNERALYRSPRPAHETARYGQRASGMSPGDGQWGLAFLVRSQLCACPEGQNPLGISWQL